MIFNSESEVQPVVIHNQNDGVFLGEALGLAFWSKLETAGQVGAVTFPSKKHAEEFMATWIGGRPEGTRLVPVTPDQGDYASMEACIAVGLEGWVVDRETPRG